jgi:hypothetical protein
MKTFILTLAFLATGSMALADGFVCQTAAGDLTVRVYNQVQPVAGTRNASIMVLSNPRVALGRKTIAKFSSESLLSNEAAHYAADVDLRYSGSNRKGELIAGTKLGYIDTIALDIDFSYAQPVAAGEVVDGILTIQKRDGSATEVQLECERYLKN